ncbi:hypothetical protein HD806DRAFT_530699 [Xylariaceae sp. AK1471]|nr:hypothetical protein HD806DRAFT_530699 [Xylariaceae sp. AK1471]
MAPDQRQETLYANLFTMEPLHVLNAHRAHLGLGPSRNLISSAAYYMTNFNPQPTPEPAENQPDNSPAYQGDISLARNMCAPIPDELNCRLWITGLPPTCTVHQLLEGIRNIGAVYACHINAPIPSGPKIWQTAAASLTFFTAEAANRLLAQSDTQPFTVENHRTTIMRHRIRTEPVEVNGRSRVLLIVGDPEIVQPEYLYRVFTECWQIRFDTDFVRFTPAKEEEEGNPNKIVWAFGSFRAQAHVVFVKINRFFGGRARALYLADPCV